MSLRSRISEFLNERSQAELRRFFNNDWDFIFVGMLDDMGVIPTIVYDDIASNDDKVIYRFQRNNEILFVCFQQQGKSDEKGWLFVKPLTTYIPEKVQTCNERKQ